MSFNLRGTNVFSNLNTPEFIDTILLINYYYVSSSGLPQIKSNEPLENCLDSAGNPYIKSGYQIQDVDIYRYGAGIKQEFTETTTGTVPSYAYYLTVILVGGGGGGGGGGKGDKNNNGRSGGGGGGGACSMMRLYPVTPGSLYKVTIGDGGYGGTREWDNPNRIVGGVGGTTTFTYNGVDLLTAPGGNPGQIGSGANIYGGGGGSGGIGSQYKNITDWHNNKTYIEVTSGSGGNGRERIYQAVGGLPIVPATSKIKLPEYGRQNYENAAGSVGLVAGRGGLAGIGGNTGSYKSGNHGSSGVKGYACLYWFGGLPQ